MEPSQFNYCRLCAELKNDTELKNCGNDSKMSEKINIKLSRVNAIIDSEIDLPKTFCLECLNLLDKAFEFVNQVHKSQETLKKLAEESSSNACITLVPLTNAVEENNCTVEVPVSADEDSKTSLEFKTECTSDDNESYSEEVRPAVINELNKNKTSLIIEPAITWNDVNWKCALCDSNYSNYKDLIAHTMQEHNCCSAYVCTECSAKRYNLNNFMIHIQKFHKPTLIECCYECNETFTSRAELRTHCKSKHITLEYVCSGCNANFKTVEELNKHTDTFFRKHFVQKQNKPTKIGPAITWESYIWKCILCEHQFPTCDDLITHSIETHSRCNPFSCIDCSHRTSNLNRFIKHIQQKHRRPLTRSCYKCFKSFISLRYTNNHRRVHKISEFMCDGCNACFQNEEEATKHKEAYFKENKVKNEYFKGMFEGLTCLVCKKSFPKIVSLITHLRMHLGRPKNYVCDECGKQCYNQHLLAEHKASHLDTKAFKCEICGFAFKVRSKLVNHVKNVHSTNKIKSYTCEHCNKSFKRISYLNNHMNVHLDSSPWVCEVCKKGFKRKVYLKRHMRNHTGVKEYYCDACKHEFSYWSNYNKHMIRIHKTDMRKKKRTGKRPQLDESMLQWKEQVCKPLKRGTKPKVDVDTNVSDIPSTTEGSSSCTTPP